MAAQEDNAADVLTDFAVTERGSETWQEGPISKMTATYRQGRRTIDLVQWNLARPGGVASISAAAETNEMKTWSATFAKMAGSIRCDWDPKAHG